MADRPLLQVQDLHVSYGKITALRGVSVDVDEGEIVALVGANGAGKSTLLRTISGLLAPRSGHILFKGERIDRRPANRIVKAGIAHVPEGRRVFPRFDTRENLKMGGFTRPDFDRLDAEIDKVIESVPVLKRRSSSASGALSGGEQQMLAIHRALMSKPTLLLLDEPSMGLAPVLVDGVMDLVASLNRQGTTVLLVEQNAVAAFEIAHRAYVLSAGEVVMSGTASTLLEQPGFASSYLGV